MQHVYKSIIVLLLSATASMSVYAQYKPMNINTSKNTSKSMNMGMSEEMKDRQAQAIQKYILQRDELSDQIRDEKNSAKKQALMAEQLKLIKKHEESKRAMKKKMMKKHHQKMMNKKSMKM
jgi:FKBP-type peptidyl-prolyl cis-trans isomerase